MASKSEIEDALIKRAGQNDQDAVNDLFEMHRERLRRMVRVRLNPRISARVDDADVVQEAFAEAAGRLREYLREPRTPFFLWLRKITSHKLIDIHRRHLGAEARNAELEIPLHGKRLPPTSSISLAAQLLGKLTSPTQAAVRSEAKRALQDALQLMDPIDREILSLRHFEFLSNKEAAEELEMETSAASKRYLRALTRLQGILKQIGLVL